MANPYPGREGVTSLSFPVLSQKNDMRKPVVEKIKTDDYNRINH